MKKISLIFLAIFTNLGSLIAADPPGFHGMLVLGNESVYISHLPMFHHLHKYQGVWKANFSKAGVEKNSVYKKVKEQNPDQIFTLAPTELFPLPSLQTRKSFKADIYLGHFERPGNQKILANVDVVLEKVVHFHSFKPVHIRPNQLTTFVVGQPGEFYLSHLITKAPNFDQWVKVSFSGEAVKEGDLVVFESNDQQPLSGEVGDKLEATLISSGVAEPISVTIEQVYYLEVNELK